MESTEENIAIDGGGRGEGGSCGEMIKCETNDKRSPINTAVQYTGTLVMTDAGVIHGHFVVRFGLLPKAVLTAPDG